MKTTDYLVTNNNIDESSTILSLFERACRIAHLKEEEVQLDFDEQFEKPAVLFESQPRRPLIEALPQKWNLAMIRSHKIPHRSGVLTYTTNSRIPTLLSLYDYDDYDVWNALRVSRNA
jgi:hypothetical protein